MPIRDRFKGVPDELDAVFIRDENKYYFIKENYIFRPVVGADAPNHQQKWLASVVQKNLFDCRTFNYSSIRGFSEQTNVTDLAGFEQYMSASRPDGYEYEVEEVTEGPRNDKDGQEKGDGEEHPKVDSTCQPENASSNLSSFMWSWFTCILLIVFAV